MKPLGRKTVRFQSKEDCNPRNGEQNWWEDIAQPNKAKERRDTLRQIEKDRREYERQK